MRVAARIGGAVAPIIGAALLALPVALVAASLFAGEAATQAHIWTTAGPRYLFNTATLCLIVGGGAAIFGAGAATLVSLAAFPGRRILSVALVLPFAIPAYISAYAYGDLVGPFGLLRERLGAATPLPEIRSLPGAAFILTMAVYPYVYLAVRASFESRSAALLEAARMLGATPARAVLRVLLPAGRAAFAGGVALAMMEVAADYGVADYYGVATLSVGIFRTWHGLGDLIAASQLAAGLFALALMLVLIEASGRKGLAAESSRAHRAPARFNLSSIQAAGAIAFCALPVVLGFVAPALVLVANLVAPPPAAAAALAQALWNTAAVAGAGAALSIAAAVALAYSTRRSSSAFKIAATRAATLGYAVPGAVIAIGVLAVADGARAAFGAAVSGIALLLYAYTGRFLTAAYNAVDAGVAQIHPLTDDAARNLGAGPARLLARIHWPIAAPAIAAGALVVFIDVARELPATLLLRPFNFETLATRVYRLASDERLADAAPAALLLVLLSLAPTLWLDAFGRRKSRSGE